jgi:hypothetical protein
MAVSGDLVALPADSSGVAIRGGTIRIVGYGGGGARLTRLRHDPRALLGHLVLWSLVTVT